MIRTGPAPVPESRARLLAEGAVLGALAGFFVRDLDLATLLSYGGDRTPFVAWGAGLGALLALTPLRRPLAGLVGLLGLGFLLVAFTPLCAWLYAGLARRDAPAPADAVCVSASRLQQDGEPTTTAMNRLVHALELLGEGRAPRLVLTELPPPQPSYAAVARPLMRRLGLRAELIALGPVGNSRDEALAFAALCRQRGFRRVVLVTSPTHSRRAAAAVEHEGVAVVSSPCLETRFDLERLDRADERLGAFGNLLHERVGLLVYARRGWIDPEAARWP
jgi:uncharacterized SAM-binding protein YcdF (DUF218 family)